MRSNRFICSAVAVGGLLFSSSLGLLAKSPAEAEKPAVSEAYPEFSWGRIPLYMHIRKATEYTDKELEYIAKFPLITFEKANGHKAHGSVEAGTLVSARAVKKLNPNATILYYRNVIVHYSGYAVDAGLKNIPGALLKDDKGDMNLVRGKVPAYDMSDPVLRDWWVKACKVMTDDPAIDGVFLDGNIKALEPGYLKRQIGVEKKKATMEGYHEMMKQTREAIGPDKLMVANILRARFENGGLEYLNYFDGSYLEAFSHNVGGMSREDYEAKGIASMQKAAREGKIIAFSYGLGEVENDSKMKIDEIHGKAESDEQAIKALAYPLGIFLICAEKYSYLRVHEGYAADKDDRWMRHFEEYDRPLGAPSGQAKKDGYVYTRQFKHAEVTLDLKKRIADINWLSPVKEKK